jgi:hypothetical protein
MNGRAGWALAPLLACTVENPGFLPTSGGAGGTTVVTSSASSGVTSGVTSGATSGTMSGSNSATSSTTEAVGTTASASGTTCPEGQDGCEGPPDPCGRGEGCTGAADWLVRSGDGAIQRGSDAALLDDGGVVVVGSFAGQLGADALVIDAPFDPQQGDGYVLRYSPDGALLWLRGLGGTGLQWATTVAAMPGGSIAVGGNFSGQLVVADTMLMSIGNTTGFLGVFGANGSLQWLTSFGGGDVYVRDLAATPDGGVAVVGDYIGSLAVGQNEYVSTGLDPFIIHFDATGQPLWSMVANGDGADGARGVAIGPDGSTTVIGYFSVELNLGGAALASHGATDVFVARHSPGGKHIASGAFGGPGQDFGSAVAISPTGRMVFAGTHREGFDIGSGPLPVTGEGFNAFFGVFEPDGALVWAHGGVQVLSVDVAAGIDELGRVVVLAPAAPGEIDFGDGAMPSTPGAYLAKYATDGALAWVHSLQGGVAVFGHELDVDAQGRIAVSGSFNNTLMYPGVDSLNAAGEFDVFAGRFQP